MPSEMCAFANRFQPRLSVADSGPPLSESRLAALAAARFAERGAARSRREPSAEDRAFVASLMGRVAEPGKFANWIAPPSRGINNQPVEFEYVRFN